NHHHDYQHSHLDLTALTPKLAHRQMGYDRPQRMNNILTSATEPYDLTLSRSFQNLSHLQPSYELPLKPDLSKYSPHRLISGLKNYRLDVEVDVVGCTS
ncbi:hypothetical protein CHARACLAT_002581, partial [Characodon lateralis]|nr:hypothetical protein [Characodon lateralis]